MGELAYLRTAQQRTQEPEQHGMTKLGSMFVIPDWMFDERPHLVSRDDPASLRYVCQTCGLMEPKAKENGYIRRRCACELALYEQWSHAAFKSETQAATNAHKASRTYTWLGDSE